jgi:hypothetical protein
VAGGRALQDGLHQHHRAETLDNTSARCNSVDLTSVELEKHVLHMNLIATTQLKYGTKSRAKTSPIQCTSHMMHAFDMSDISMDRIPTDREHDTSQTIRRDMLARHTISTSTSRANSHQFWRPTERQSEVTALPCLRPDPEPIGTSKFVFLAGLNHKKQCGCLVGLFLGPPGEPPRTTPTG